MLSQLFIGVSLLISYQYSRILLNRSRNPLDFSPILSFFSRNCFLNLFQSNKHAPCKNVRILLKDRLIPGIVNCTEKCLAIYKRGRFGNHYYSFAGSIVIAKSSGMKKVVIPPGFLMMNKSFYYDDIYFEISNNTTGCIYTDTFAIPLRLRKQALHHRLSKKFRTFFMSRFPNIFLSNRTLVVHVRSGDIFVGDGANRHYGQPPCNYYLNIIRMKKWDKVIMISEDEGNPCVRIISKVIGDFKKRSFFLDLAILLNAKNLVLSEGTIGISIVALSNKTENVYTFTKFHDRAHPVLYYVNVYNCVPTLFYYIFVMKLWKNMNIQKLYMKMATINRWKYHHAIR